MVATLLHGHMRLSQYGEAEINLGKGQQLAKTGLCNRAELRLDDPPVFSTFWNNKCRRSCPACSTTYICKGATTAHTISVTLC